LVAVERRAGLSSKKPSKDYQIKVTNKLDYYINNDGEILKGRHTNGQEGP